MSIQFEFLDADAIQSNVTPNGVRYLEIFLNEYSELTGEKDINAGCNRCIANYLTTFKKIKFKMKNPNKCKYVLKEKYNNIPLEFGSNIFVNNSNITDEYAATLLKVHKAENIFDEVGVPKPKRAKRRPKAVVITGFPDNKVVPQEELASPIKEEFPVPQVVEKPKEEKPTKK